MAIRTPILTSEGTFSRLNICSVVYQPVNVTAYVSALLTGVFKNQLTRQHAPIDRKILKLLYFICRSYKLEIS